MLVETERWVEELKWQAHMELAERNYKTRAFLIDQLDGGYEISNDLQNKLAEALLRVVKTAANDIRAQETVVIGGHSRGAAVVLPYLVWSVAKILNQNSGRVRRIVVVPVDPVAGSMYVKTGTGGSLEARGIYKRMGQALQTLKARGDIERYLIQVSAFREERIQRFWRYPGWDCVRSAFADKYGYGEARLPIDTFRELWTDNWIVGAGLHHSAMTSPDWEWREALNIETIQKAVGVEAVNKLYPLLKLSIKGRLDDKRVTTAWVVLSTILAAAAGVEKASALYKNNYQRLLTVNGAGSPAEMIAYHQNTAATVTEHLTAVKAIISKTTNLLMGEESKDDSRELVRTNRATLSEIANMLDILPHSKDLLER